MKQKGHGGDQRRRQKDEDPREPYFIRSYYENNRRKVLFFRARTLFGRGKIRNPGPMKGPDSVFHGSEGIRKAVLPSPAKAKRRADSPKKRNGQAFRRTLTVSKGMARQPE